MRNFFVLLFIVANFISFSTYSQTPANSIGTGTWNDPTVWDCACVPGTGYDVVITAGTTITTTVNATATTLEVAGALVIDPGVTLNINGNTNASPNYFMDFVVDAVGPGTVTNNGTLTLDAGAAGALYSNQSGSTFTNNSVVTVDNGGSFDQNGTFANSGTFTIDNGAVFQTNATITNTGTINTNNSSTISNYTSINNTGGTLNVSTSSLFVNNAGGSFGGGNGTININATATYQHAQNNGTIPTCTWNATSTCLITGQTSASPSLPGGLGQSFGNFTWNTTGLSGNISLAGNLTTINGDFTLLETNAGRLVQFATTQSPTINISGNIVVSATGTDGIQFATTGVPVVNVGGNVSVTSGRIILGAGGATSTLNITGDLFISATTANALSLSGNNLTTGTINLTGDLVCATTNTTAITETTAGGAATGVINFIGDVTHTFSTNVANPLFRRIQLNVTANDVLDISGSTTNLTLHSNAGTDVNSLTVASTATLVTGTITIAVNNNTTPAVFTLSSGATLSTNNTSGVNATVTGAGTRTFDNAANYILGGASVTTGFTSANTTMNDLTTTANATLGEAVVINGDFLHTAGTFNAGTNNMTVASDFTNNGTINAGSSAITVGNIFTNGGTFLASTSTVTVAGNFLNNATFTANTGLVAFNGTANQSIGGTAATTFYNLTTNNSCGACTGVSLATNANLINVLTINTNSFVTTGFNFTLESDASGTASIGPITGATANFVGNVRAERYAQASMNGDDWRFFGTPIVPATATLADWADDVYTTGFTGSDDPSNSFISIYSYDETVSDVLDSGYVPASNITDPIAFGQGFWVYLGPSPATYTVSGAPNKGSQSLPVSFTAAISEDDDGWNLVANPYPCVIDWNAGAWTKTSMDDCFYVYNSTTGTFAYYCPQDSIPISGNGGSQYIASHQAFWVKANTDVPAPALTIAENCKVTSVSQSFLRTNEIPVNQSTYPSAFKDFPVPQATNNVPGRLRLTALGGGGYADEIFVHFKGSATNGYDKKYDAWKLISPDWNAHNFSSVINDTVDLAVNGMPSLTGDVHIPLRLTVPATGVYSIKRDSVIMLPLSSCITLEDKATAAMIDLRTVVTYTFSIADTTAAPRFVLHITAPITKSSARVSCSGGNNGKASAKGLGAGPWNYTWKDSSGATVQTTLGSSTADTLYNCVAGIYSVTVTGGSCGPVTDTVKVNEPPVLATTSSAIAAVCFGDNNGSASITASGGNAGYTYAWSNGATTAQISGLSAQMYTITVSDAKGCTVTASVTVTQPLAVTNTVTQTNVSCFGLTNGSAAIAAGGGTPSYSYLWSTGATVAQVSGLNAQPYTVTVTDSKGCSATSTVTVTQPLALTNTVSSAAASCFGENDGSVSVNVAGGSMPYAYSWSGGQTTSSVSGMPAGNFSVLVTDNMGCTSTATVAVSQPAVIVSGFSVSNDTLDLAIGADVTLTNASSGATSYEWSFGDASAPDNSTNAMHTYTAAGTYTVMLISSNGPCADTSYKNIVVTNSNPTSVNNFAQEGEVNVTYENGQAFLSFNFSQAMQVNIRVYNLLAEEVLVLNNVSVKNNKVRLDVPQTAGMYIAVAEMKEISISRKITLPIR